MCIEYSRTKGCELLRYNGIIDLAIQSCKDEMFPSFDFGLEKILPTCDGIVENRDFSGFVTYYTNYRRIASDEEIKDYIIKKALRDVPVIMRCDYYNSCNLKKYYKDCHSKKYKFCLNRDCCHKEHTLDEINLAETEYIIIEQKHTDLYLNKNSEIRPIVFNGICLCKKGVSYSSTKYVIVKKDDITLAGLNEIVKENQIIPDNSENFKKIPGDILFETFKTENHIIKPKNNAVIGDLDINIGCTTKQHIENLLCNMLKLPKYDDGVVIPNDLNILEQTLSKFNTINIPIGESSCDKYTVIIKSNRFICSPKLEEEKHFVLGCNYYWCAGHKCFRNRIKSQVLKNTPNWQEYTLFHIFEIVGYKKVIEHSDNIYEADEVIGKFVGTVNKVKEVLLHLKCKDCGHLLFPTDKNNRFNKYNWYQCLNPQCKSYKEEMYINHCFSCKNGIIDSRETRQCETGMYICKSCLSCCSNENLNKRKQNYINSNVVVPNYIKKWEGKCHNDKDIFFCPECGSRIAKYIKNGKEIWGCEKCQSDCKEKYPNFSANNKDMLK